MQELLLKGEKACLLMTLQDIFGQAGSTHVLQLPYLEGPNPAR